MRTGGVYIVHGNPTVCLWNAADPEGCIVPVSFREHRDLALALLRKDAEEQEA